MQSGSKMFRVWKFILCLGPLSASAQSACPESFAVDRATASRSIEASQELGQEKSRLGEIMPSNGVQKKEKTSASKLVAAMRVAEQLDNSQQACVKGARRLDLEAQFDKDPAILRGITPQSNIWPEAVKLYKDYISASCMYLTVDDAIAAVEKEYSAGLSEEEIGLLTRFFSSHVGRKYTEVSLKASRAVDELVNDDHTSELHDTLKLYDERLIELLSRQKESHSK